MTQSIRQFIESNYDNNEIKDIATHGCVTGCAHGLVYYSETIKFHDDHRDEIWDLVEEFRKDFGHKNNMEFISTLNGAKNVHDDDQLKNLLAWFAVENMCYQIIEGL